MHLLLHNFHALMSFELPVHLNLVLIPLRFDFCDIVFVVLFNGFLDTIVTRWSFILVEPLVSHLSDGEVSNGSCFTLYNVNSIDLDCAF